MVFAKAVQRLRFWAGFGTSSFLEWMLSESRMPPVRFVPWGLSWCYDLRRCLHVGGKQVRMLFDVGANTGQTALHFSTHFPSATIHSFEPVTYIFDQLTRSTARNKNIHCHPLALGAKNSTAKIALHADITMATLQQESQSGANITGYEEVTVQRLDDFCAAHHITRIDCLKIDVEGYEMDVLRGAQNLLSTGAILALYCEIVFNNKNPERRWTEFEEINTHLRSLGYDCCGIYEYYRVGRLREYLLLANALWVNWEVIYKVEKPGQ